MKDFNIIKDEQVLKYWGNSYVKLPRVVIARMFSGNKKIRKTGLLYAVLICNCYHSDGPKTLAGITFTCFRGEFIGTREELAGMTGIKLNSIGYYLKELINEERITVRKIPGGTRIRIHGYDRFMRGEMYEEKAE